MNFDFITKPFGLLMMFFYEFTKSYGLAVILFALVVKIIMLPFQMKSKRSMMKTSRLQPKLKELEKKHGANKQKYNEEVAKLYKEEKINPMSGCLWSFIPLPIIIALYSAIRDPLTMMMGVASDLVNKGGAIYNLIEKMGGTQSGTYIQIEQAEFISKLNATDFSAFQQLSDKISQINFHSLGMNLGNVPEWQFLWKTTDWGGADVLSGFLLFLLPIASGVLAFFSSKISMNMNPVQGNAQQQQSTKSMMLMMPAISIYFGFIMPGGIGIYMIAQTLFSTIQDIILTKHYTKIMDAEDAVKNELLKQKEAELEAKREETERKKLENKTEVNPNTAKKKQQKSERQEQQEKAAEWEKKNCPPEPKAEDPSREGTRKFARGRAYDPSRFGDDGAAELASSEELPEATMAEADVLEDAVTDTQEPMSAEPAADDTKAN